MLAWQYSAWAATASILFFLSTASVCLRVLAMYKRGVRAKLHDYLVFLCYLSLSGYIVDVSFGLTHGGYGLHITEISAVSSPTAGVNLARLIQTNLCPPTDVLFCAFESSLLIVGEITGGIFVACVPTFGVIFFGGGKKSSSYQYQGARGRVRSLANRTIGQISLRPQRKPTSILDDTLKSLNDDTWNSEAMSKTLSMTEIGSV
ncbi:hypothetical protein F5Y16DRAFT_425162 [Xylariaceae sp. FL0255]|nr:hypothetical protein F5Y16DRAFT_425162 [Xylariaceae sp. FL0255]